MNTQIEYYSKSQLLSFADGVPSELKELKIWVGFMYRENPDNPNKMKKQPVSIYKLVNGISGAYNNTNLEENHCSYDDAVAALRDEKVDGIGIYLTNTPYTVIDIDGGVIWQDNTPLLNPDVNTLIEMFESWVELSSSGHGLHIFIKGKKPVRKFEYRFGEIGGEIYDGLDGHRTFIAMTGASVTDVETINENQEAFNSFAEYVWNIKPKTTTNQNQTGGVSTEGTFGKPNVIAVTNHQLTDSQIIEFILEGKDDSNQTRRNLYLMWTGEYGENDASKYELFFLKNLLFWTKKDKAQTFRVFLQSPYAMGICKTNAPVSIETLSKARGKSKTYYDNRFDKAVEYFNDADVYNGNATKFSNGENANVEESEVIPTVEEVKEIIDGVPALPGIAAIDYSIGDDVCAWLDDYS